MKYTAFITAIALLLTGTEALPQPKAEAEANPQICFCNPVGCYDSCGQELCCP